MQDSQATRIHGFDLARAFAFFGMVVVNFKLVMGAGKSGPDWLVWLVGCLEGRAAATFVVLAGCGLALQSRRLYEARDATGLVRIRGKLLKRAWFLFLAGLVYTPLWPADILHFYGVYIACGAFLISASGRTIWLTAVGFCLTFVVLLALVDYETGWNFDTLTYLDLWTPVGMIRHLFFNGFHPVFPWAAFLFIGIWLGRRDFTNPKTPWRVIRFALPIAIITELCSGWLVAELNNYPEQLSAELIEALFGTSPMPPMPQYVIAAGTTAMVVICLCIKLGAYMGNSGLLRPFLLTGQLALTLYVAHVVIGMGTLEALGFLGGQTLTFALFNSLVFCTGSILFALVWRRFFKQGPLEWCMRKITG